MEFRGLQYLSLLIIGVLVIIGFYLLYRGRNDLGGAVLAIGSAIGLLVMVFTVGIATS